MNIKDLVVSIALALGVTLLIQYIFLNNGTPSQSANVERVRIAPKTDVHRPLITEIDFWDKDIQLSQVSTLVETDFGLFTFSNEGAALVKADFKHDIGASEILIPGIKAKEREDRTFLIAFDRKTPYYFELVKHKRVDESHQLEYRAEFDGGNLTKKFTIYNHKPQIDLHVAFTPNSVTDPYRLRLVYNVPSMLQAADQKQLIDLQISEDQVFGLHDHQGGIVKKPVAALLDRYWELPSNFGGMDRYLVNTMINNSNQFAQRGYYSLSGGDSQLRVFLESPEVKDQTEWDISFYLGPKQLDAFAKVDPGLDQLLDYGMLAPLSKLLLRWMHFLYGYVGNFGLVIILITALIKLITLPLTLRGERSPEQAAELERKMQYVQQKYRHDPQALSRAKMEVIQKHGMPSMGGCLIPLLAQLPVFIALRSVLTTAFELYMAPFLWITNLVAPDPFYILPLLVGVSMFMQTSANSTDPRKKMNSLGWAIFLGALFSGFSAGISLYILANSLLSILQTTVYRRFKAA